MPDPCALASTGDSSPIITILIAVGLLGLGIGAVVAVRSSRRRGGAVRVVGALILVSTLAAGAGIAVPSPASAATGCGALTVPVPEPAPNPNPNPELFTATCTPDPIPLLDADLVFGGWFDAPWIREPQSWVADAIDADATVSMSAADSFSIDGYFDVGTRDRLRAELAGTGISSSDSVALDADTNSLHPVDPVRIGDVPESLASAEIAARSLPPTAIFIPLTTTISEKMVLHVTVLDSCGWPQSRDFVTESRHEIMGLEPTRKPGASCDQCDLAFWWGRRQAQEQPRP